MRPVKTSPGPKTNTGDPDTHTEGQTDGKQDTREAPRASREVCEKAAPVAQTQQSRKQNPQKSKTTTEVRRSLQNKNSSQEPPGQRTGDAEERGRDRPPGHGGTVRRKALPHGSGNGGRTRRSCSRKTPGSSQGPRGAGSSHRRRSSGVEGRRLSVRRSERTDNTRHTQESETSSQRAPLTRPCVSTGGTGAARSGATCKHTPAPRQQGPSNQNAG